MVPERLELPDNLADAHALLSEQFQMLHQLQHHLACLQRYVYGRRSEKVLQDATLLDYAGLLEPEAEAAAPEPEPEPEPAEPEPAPAPTKRRKKKSPRITFRDDLPVERCEHPLPDEQCVCGQCGGRLEKIGEDAARRLEYRPAVYFIQEDVSFRYACPRCKEGVVQSEKPAPPIEKGVPGAGLLARAPAQKYVDHLPLYRQEQIFAREGIGVSRKTLCDWVWQCAKLLLVIVDWMKRDVLRSRVLHTDETPIIVNGQKNGADRHRGRLWVYVGDADHPEVVFDFTPNRSRDGPLKFLKGFSGSLQADAYAGYAALYASGDVTEVGCWAHARRKFYDAKDSDSTRSLLMLGMIRRLYEIEREAKEYEEAHGLASAARAAYRRAQRQEKAKPVLEKIRAWLERTEKEVLPKSPLGVAIGYALNQWEALNRYVEDGDLCIDNNAAEQEIRPIALGRKNWLFAGSDDGGRRAAVIYSLVQTCKRHGVDPFAYFRDVLPRIGGHPIRRIHELTPLEWKRAQEAQQPAAQDLA